MESGELPFEKRGRVRYARLTDVLAWEAKRLAASEPSAALGQLPGVVHPDLIDLA